MASKTSLVLGGVVFVTACAIAVWYLRRPAPAPPAPAPATEPAAPPPSVATAPTQRPADRVTKISPEERARIADRIARARASRAAVSAPARPSLPAAAPARPALPGETMKDVDEVKTHLQEAMHEVTPFLVDCVTQYREALGPSTVMVNASMLLDGDPDVGTLITAEALQNRDGKALPAGFDDCVRDTMQSLQLPPLAEGSAFKVSYMFSFATEPDDGSAGSAR